MERKLVRKSNYLIEASFKLSAIEQKIILVLVSMIKPEDQEFKAYSLKAQDLSQFLGLQTNNLYAYLKDVTKSLMSKVFTITTPNSEIQTHWFSSVEYFEGHGDMEFSFDPKLKPFLLQLKERFTSYRLQEAVQLKSSFSIRMLELLRQYEKLGERVVEVSRLRDLLGIEDDQYRLYADFKRRVILAAQKELREKTEISFDFFELKRGHAVEKLKFKIHVRARPKHGIQAIEQLLGKPEDPELSQLLQLLPEAYRDKASIKKLISSYLEKSGVEHVARNIIYTNEKSNAVKPGPDGKATGNYRNYLAKALRDDFGLAFQEDREAVEELQKKERDKKDAILAAARQERERIERDQENAARARTFRENLTPEALESMRQEALANLDETQRNLVIRKAPGSDIILRLEMDKICFTRMNIT